MSKIKQILLFLVIILCYTAVTSNTEYKIRVLDESHVVYLNDNMKHCISTALRLTPQQRKLTPKMQISIIDQRMDNCIKRHNMSIYNFLVTKLI